MTEDGKGQQDGSSRKAAMVATYATWLGRQAMNGNSEGVRRTAQE